MKVKAMKNTAILWEGKSPFNGEPIVALISGLTKPSCNPKTGPALQVWILPKKEHPMDAKKGDRLQSVCGTCPLQAGKGCYVNFMPLGKLWKNYKSGKTPAIDAVPQRILKRILKGSVIRWGAYGDPAFLPLSLIKKYNALSSGHLGYTHQWRMREEYRGVFMASADSPEEQQEAVSKGWRVFRIRLKNELLLKGEIACPADKNVHDFMLVKCIDCQLCDGRKKGRDSRKNIAIVVHGNGSASKFSKMRMSV